MSDDHKQTSRQKPGLILHGAAFYDLTVWLFTLGREHSFREKILHLVNLKGGESVLDVGCGTGSLAMAAKEKVGAAAAVCGLDASSEMLARARKKALKAGLEIDFTQGIVQVLPYPDSSFDVVLTSVMLHHLSKKGRQQCVEEMRRVVKPGGRILAVEFSKPSPHSLLAHIHHHGYLDIAEIVRLVNDAGLKAAESGAVGFKNTHFVLAERPVNV